MMKIEAKDPVRQPSLEDTVAFLLDTPMFRDLKASELASVVQILDFRQVEALEPVFREGDAGDAWYVVYRGALEVKKSIGSSQHVIASLTPGSCFGEMAILDGSSRSAAVVATRESSLFRFPREPFNELLMSGVLAAYKLVYQLALVLVQRQRLTTSRLVQLLGEEDPLKLHEGLHPIVGRSVVAE